MLRGVNENYYEIHLNEPETLYQRMYDILHGMLTNPATGMEYRYLHAADRKPKWTGLIQLFGLWIC
jgi:hypothetical protein